MWSVPRSMGTVLLQAWSNRPDTVVFDELLSFPYLYFKKEDLGFTWAELNANDMAYSDWKAVVERLQGPRPEENWRVVVEMLKAPLAEGKTICYQKHQAYHLLEETMGFDWILPFNNCFLIRQPRDMLLSLHKVVPGCTFEQTGWSELKRLFDYVYQQSGTIPVVLDAQDLLNDPPRMLARLCDAVGVDFSESMLHWPAMKGELNAKLSPWYSVVASSTHFRPPQARKEQFPAHLEDICRRCDEVYQALYQYRLL